MRIFVQYRKFAILALILSLALLFWVRSVPKHIETLVLDELQSLSSENIVLVEDVVYSSNSVTFQNIQLDKHGIDIIKSVHISLSYKSYFGMPHIKALIIDSPALTRSFKLPEANILEQLNNRILNFGLLEKVDLLEVKNGTLDLATGIIGAIRIKIDGNVRLNKSDNLNAFQWSVESVQKGLSISSRISGIVSFEDQWSSEIMIDGFGLETDQFALKRGNTAFNIGGNIHNEFYLNGETNIGLADVNGFLFKEVAASIEHTQSNTVWTMAGMALEYDNIEAGLSYDTKESNFIHGSLYAGNLSDLYYFLWPETRDQEQAKEIPLSKINDIFLTFTLLKNELFLDTKKVRITAETINLDVLPVVFKDYVSSAKGDARIQLIAELKDRKLMPIQGLIRSHNAGSIVLNRKGMRAISGKNRNSALSALKNYDSFKIDFNGNVMEEADWKLEVLPENKDSIVWDHNLSLNEFQRYLIAP